MKKKHQKGLCTQADGSGSREGILECQVDDSAFANAGPSGRMASDLGLCGVGKRRVIEKTFTAPWISNGSTV